MIRRNSAWRHNSCPIAPSRSSPKTTAPTFPFAIASIRIEAANTAAAIATRPSHEYLGLGAGLDFESKIFVKERRRNSSPAGSARRLAAGNDLLFRHHRLLPAGRAELRTHPRLPAGGGRGATADRHHHQEQARDPRPRRAGADGRALCWFTCRSASQRSTSNWPGGWSRARADRPRGSKRFASCRGPACPRG